MTPVCDDALLLLLLCLFLLLFEAQCLCMGLGFRVEGVSSRPSAFACAARYIYATHRVEMPFCTFGVLQSTTTSQIGQVYSRLRRSVAPSPDCCLTCLPTCLTPYPAPLVRTPLALRRALFLRRC